MKQASRSPGHIAVFQEFIVVSGIYVKFDAGQISPAYGDGSLRIVVVISCLPTFLYCCQRLNGGSRDAA